MNIDLPMRIFGSKKTSATSNARGTELSSPTGQTGQSSLQDRSLVAGSDKIPRRTQMARQITTDHISPPAIQPGEIDSLCSQVEDLSRCGDNPVVFDILLSDIDRNRLTQITMMLAERGDFPTMARVVQISDNLDRLIKDRVYFTHKRQWEAVGAGSPADYTIDDFECEIDRVISDLGLETEELREKITFFDQCFSDFQDEPFERLIRLSDKIDVIRKRISKVIFVDPADTDGLNTDPHEEWETFPTSLSPAHAGSVNVIGPGGPVQANPAIQLNTTDEAGTSPKQLLSPTDQAQHAASPDILQSTKLTQMQMDISQSEPTVSSLEPGCDRMIAWLTHVYLRRLRSALQHLRIYPIGSIVAERVPRRSLRLHVHAWTAAATTAQADLSRMTSIADEFCNTVIGNRLLSASLAAWMTASRNQRFQRSAGVAAARKIFIQWRVITWRKVKEDARSNDLSRSILRTWKAIALRSAELKLIVDARSKYRILGPVLVAWISHCNECRNKRFLSQVSHRDRISSKVLHAWLRLVQDANNTATRTALSPRREFGIFTGPEHEAPTSPEAWFEELPVGVPDKAEECDVSIPDSVEHYIIHDSPKISTTLSIKEVSEEIISRAQIFLSQRQLRNQLPTESRGTPVHTSHRHPQPVHETSYSSWFERKWAMEESLWGV